MSTNQKNTGHFPGLTELRGLAALGVLIYHLEDSKRQIGLASLMDWTPIARLGTHSVACFFVLAGFLITALLLRAREFSGRIDLITFYRKRFLRIVPLYLFITIFSFFIFPFLNPFPNPAGQWAHLSWENLRGYLFFFPQLVVSKYPIVHGASQLWTIGLEIQYYLIWPLALCWLSRAWLAVGVLFLIKTRTFLTLTAFIQSQIDWSPAKLFFDILILFSGQVPGGAFLVGSLFGWILYRRPSWLTGFFFHPGVQLIALLGIFIGYFLPFEGTLLIYQNQPIFALWMGILILNLAGNPRSLIKLNSGFLERCGTISYGIYIYHTSILCIVLGLLIKIPRLSQHLILFNGAVYGLSSALTLILSHYSYYYFEKKLIDKISRSRVFCEGVMSCSLGINPFSIRK